MHRLLASFALASAFCLLVLATPTFAQPAATRTGPPDLLIADFEAETYGAWKVTGEAFGKTPARGTLNGQMQVEGFQGKGLVNSFVGGDDATGTLTSPPFKIERNYINFLIGGGGWKDETCIQLKVDGKIVRNTAGPNTNQGGSERLEWASWDVAEFAGNEATIEIIDTRKGGWGHINVDQIMQSNVKRAVGPAKIKLEVTGRYLRLPAKRGAANNRLKATAGDKLLIDCDIQLAEELNSQPFLFDLGEEKAPANIEIEIAKLANDSPLQTGAWKWFTDDATEGLKDVIRPRFHFTAQRGWLNDPNGLVYHGGKYHLYFQHNPFGSEWGNMHWGHAVSTDLLTWKELPIAIAPPKHGDWAFSGSALVDTENLSGFGTKENPPIVAAWTSTGRGECISYSTDGGTTFKEFEGNPVVKHQGRDPRILWHAESKQWVMAVYDESEGKQWIAFYNSPDLKKWTFASKIEGYFECPEVFPMPVEDTRDSKWILYAADGQYVVGEFDGKVFTPQSKKQALWYGNFYASQTFSNAPEQRRIQVGWARGIDSHGQAFNQQMNLPCDLRLRREGEGYQLNALPVRDLKNYQANSRRLDKVQLGNSEKTVGEVLNAAYVVTTNFMVQDGEVDLYLGENRIRYSKELETIECQGVKAPLQVKTWPLRLQVIVDAQSIELFVNDGEVAIAAPAAWPPKAGGIRVVANGECNFGGGDVWKLLASPKSK